MAIPAAFLNAVVAIGVEGGSGEIQWIGTGFIVNRREYDNPDLSTYYIVTNKHVIGVYNRISIRFNYLGENLVKDYAVNLYDSNNTPLYSVHPHNETDVVAFQIIPQTLINDKSIWNSFDLINNSLTLEEMQKEGLYEGTLVYALGFPMSLVNMIKAPICRLGCISRVMDAFVFKNQNPVYLVDAQTFPGNSGGPIISRPEYPEVKGEDHRTYKLIGILSAYIPYRETLYSRQTGGERMIQEENSGLTIVHPVDRIKEVVELEWKRVSNN